MKYLVILGDGMADEPLPELDGKTPLMAADTPWMDYIAKNGACGMACTVPAGYTPGSDIANLSVLGYDPARYYTGRGALEAMSMGINLAGDDVAYRCNLVTVTDSTMQDFSAGHITSTEGALLLLDLNRFVSDSRNAHFYPGVSYRNVLVLAKGGGSDTTPPHDIVGEPIESYLPKGPDSTILRSLMDTSRDVFSNHEVNTRRQKDNKAPVTQIWPWSGGKRPDMPLFKEKYGLRGGMISAVDLLNGIATCTGMEVIHVPGATGYLDTDYDAKARYALDAFDHLDFVYVHVEAPDEAGHMGSLDEKILAIERIDMMIGTILERFDGIIGILPDHPTPVRVKTHTCDPVPFAILGWEIDDTVSFSEEEAKKGSYGCIDATMFLPLLFTGSFPD